MRSPSNKPQFRSSAVTLPVALTSISCLLSPIFSANAQEKINFKDHILPMLEERCLNCHNPDDQKGGLDLTSFGVMMAGGSGGDVVAAGAHDRSRMWTTAMKLEEPFMPPRGQALS